MFAGAAYVVLFVAVVGAVDVVPVVLAPMLAYFACALPLPVVVVVAAGA